MHGHIAATFVWHNILMETKGNRIMFDLIHQAAFAHPVLTLALIVGACAWFAKVAS